MIDNTTELLSVIVKGMSEVCLNNQSHNLLIQC